MTGAHGTSLSENISWNVERAVKIPVGASASEIQNVINTATPNTVIELSAGNYTIDRTLVLQGDRVALVGAGEGQTVLKASSSLGDATVIQAGHELHKPDYTGSFALAGSSGEGASYLHLADAGDLRPGDTLWLSRENTAGFFEEIGDEDWQDDKPLRTSLVEIIEVKGNTVIVDPPLSFDFVPGETEVQRIDLAEDVVLGGFTIEGAYGESDPADFSNTISAAAGQVSVSVAGTSGAKLFDIDIKEPASNGFVFAKLLDVNALSLSVNGAHNKGTGGEGYGIWIRDVYESAFAGLSVFDTRHAVVFASYTSATGNTVHVAGTNRDINFHGGRDHGNTVVVDSSVREGPEQSYLGWVAFVNEGTHYGAPTEADANELTFRTVSGSNKGDWIVAHEDGATIDGAGGDDLIIGGAGNDSLDGEDGADTIAGLAGFDHVDGGTGEDLFETGLWQSQADVFRTTEGYFIYSEQGTTIVENVELIGFLNGTSRLAAPGEPSAGAGQGTGGDYVLDHDLTLAQGSSGWERRTVSSPVVMANDLEAVRVATDLSITIVGNVLANNVLSGGGHDVIVGLGGNDRLFGRAGDDVLDGGDGDDFLSGGHGNDVLIGADGRDELAGRAGQDLFMASEGRNVVLDFETGADSFHFDGLSEYHVREALLSFEETGKGTDRLAVETLILNDRDGLSLTSIHGDNLLLTDVSALQLWHADALFQ